MQCQRWRLGQSDPDGYLVSPLCNANAVFIPSLVRPVKTLVIWAGRRGYRGIVCVVDPGAPGSRRVQGQEGVWFGATACVGVADRVFGPGEERL